MRELLDPIEIWMKEGQAVALATVIKTWGSSPRPVGAGLAVTGDGQIIGSVSGGCVEGAVIETAREVLRSGKPVRLFFGVADDDAWEVGLACGGEIEVFIRNFDKSQLGSWRKALNTEQTFCGCLKVGGPDDFLGRELMILESGKTFGDTFPGEELDLIINLAMHQLQGGTSGCQKINDLQSNEFFMHLVKPKPKLILVGGVHIAIPLVKMAEIVGFDVIVIDPRRLFGTEERFPEVKQLIQEWPGQAFQKIDINQSTAIIMLTHDPKIDDPALKIALGSPAFYVGALGSKKTHQKRIKRLAKDGVESKKLDLIHAPIGLDLGGRSPEEIALAVIAEVVKVWNAVKKRTDTQIWE